jgi:Ferritin-like
MATPESASPPTIQSLLAGLQTFETQHEQAADVPPKEQELEALRKSLEAATAIEFATIPPYLTALWSIKDRLHPFAISLKTIVQEEMLHLALATNMLAAIGGKPRFNVDTPQYPSHLPHGVHPELTVSLRGFSPEALQDFLIIERPDNQDYKEWLNYDGDLITGDQMSPDSTIGAFYDKIRKAFHRLNPPLSADHQLSGPLSWMVVKNLDDIDEAIGIIQQQGEGSWGSPNEGRGEYLAHFFRFAQMKEQKKLLHDPATGKWDFTTPIRFDMNNDVYPVGEVPAGGYTNLTNPELCARHRGFNITYSRLMDLFQDAWTKPGGQALLVHAIEVMFELQDFAVPLMQITREGDDHTYGPEFRYYPREERADAGLTHQ